MHYLIKNHQRLKIQVIYALLVPSCLFAFSCTRPGRPTKVAHQPISATSKSSFVIGNGVNLQPSYYNQGEVNFAWALMKSKDRIKTVRLEIEPDRVKQATEWIRQAGKAGYSVIATYHHAKILGTDHPQEVQKAADWWQKNYDTLISGLPKDEQGKLDSSRLIINLINEWGSHNITPASYAKAYNAAISVIRTFYKGYIILDIPGWGQETYTAYQACKISNPRITDPKIALSAHIYRSGYNQGRGHTLQPDDLKDMQNTGYPCIIGEFGTGQGPCHWDSCVAYARKLGWPVIGWCWNGDGGAMNMVTPSWQETAFAARYSFTPYFDSIYQHL